MSKLLSIAIVVCIAFACAPASATPWVVQQVTGEVSVAPKGATPVALAPTAELDRGATVTTGATGRVLLTRGKETMIVGPGSVVTIPGDTASGFTRILQQHGSVVYDVDRRNVKHFEVDTPFLAALVKGTQFKVSVRRRDADVSVTRGRVGVSDTVRGGGVDILPGQTAKVADTAPLSVSGVIDKGQVAADAAAHEDMPDDSDNKGKNADKGKDADKDKSGGKGKDTNGDEPKNSNSGKGGSSGKGAGDGNSGDGKGNSDSGGGSGKSASDNSGSGKGKG